MPKKSIPDKPRSRQNIQQVRDLLRGVAREDSDDELGSEDLPWEWIYENSADDLNCVSASPTPTPSRKHKADPSPCKLQPKKIIGAKMGNFMFQMGDCLLIKGEDLARGEAYVGMACDLMEDSEEGMQCRVVWFSTEHEIQSKKKRTDFLPNELYINPSMDWIPLPSINGKAIVVSEEEYQRQYPKGVSRKSKDYGKVFICRRGCAPRTTTYTEEFIWEEIYKGKDTNLEVLYNRISEETKVRRKRRAVGKAPKVSDDMFDFIADSDEEILDPDLVPLTPRKRQKTGAGAVSIKWTPSKFTTPSHKRIVQKKPLEFTPLTTRVIPEFILESPYALARSRLHVAAVPTSLPCRETEFTEVYVHLEAAISDGFGSCIYISGTPGTGKTATVREVIAQLQQAVINEELEDFIFVEINGMKIADPHQSYSLLWEAIKGERVTPNHALNLLEHEFTTPSPRRVPCVVLMDELDQLVTKNQSVMYNFFNWPGVRHSKLIVVAVANTMDLPERTLSNKISSRLGLTRITFPGYTYDQLMKIIQSRLEGVQGNIVDPDAIQFASRKVAAVSGDARRALDICRRAVEIVEYAYSKLDTSPAPSAPNTPTRKGRGVGTGPLATTTPTKVPLPAASQGRVTIPIIKQAINEATSSTLQKHLKHLPITAKVFLAAIVARIRRSGVSENLMADVIEEAERIVKMSGGEDIEEILMANSAIGGKGAMGGNTRVAGLLNVAMMLSESGIVGLELRRGERAGRVRLNVGEDEVTLAFKDDKEVCGMFGG